MVLRFLRKFDFYILLDFPYILLFCNRRKSCPTQTQRINKYFLKKGIKKGRISEKHLWNSPQNEQVIGSNPHQRSILPIGIFLFSLKTDFWKSEENGEKTRKTEEILGFSGCIFFGCTMWLRHKDSNLGNDGVRVRCLTAWRYPNLNAPYYSTFSAACQ